MNVLYAKKSQGEARMVKVVESCMVVPDVETPKHGLWVSNLDLLAPRTHTTTVYFYRSNGSPSFFFVETLKSSLAKTLVLFYPFAGRLGMEENDRVMIDCNGKGALFLKAEAESTMDEFGDFTPSMKTRELLVPKVDYTDEGHGASQHPLLLLQVTFFKCGGVCLGVGIHHTLSDGAASLHFINSWSDIARGLNVAILPFFDRTLLRARSPPMVPFNHTEYKRNPQTKSSSQKNKPLSSVILTLSSEQLSTLRKNITNNNKEIYSTYEMVAAHVWRCACMARKLSYMKETRVYITADARNRLQPPLPPGYLGNAIFTSSAISVAGDITSKPIEYAASKIRAAIYRLDDEYLRSSLDFLELQEDLRGLGRGAGTFPSTDLSIVSWTRLPIYEADFGWGRPAFMGPAAFFYGGLAYIMRSPSKDSVLSLALSLETESMSRFRELFYQLELGELRTLDETFP